MLGLLCRQGVDRVGRAGHPGIGFEQFVPDQRGIHGNACYLGILQDRWQAFAYSQDVGFGRCLDVLAHEYTHCITDTSAAGGMYKDDYGAINEAISDILGTSAK